MSNKKNTKSKPVGWPSVNEEEHQRHVAAGLKGYYGTDKPLTKEEIEKVKSERTKRALERDQDQDAKIIVERDSPESIKWENNPNKMDLQGVDTKKTKGERLARKQYVNLKDSIEDSNSSSKLHRMEIQLGSLHDNGYITDEQYKKTKHRLHEQQYQVAGDKVDKELLKRERHALGKALEAKVDDEEFEKVSKEAHDNDRKYQRNPTVKNRKELEKSISKLEKLGFSKKKKKKDFNVKYCNRCERQVPYDAKECPYCGRKRGNLKMGRHKRIMNLEKKQGISRCKNCNEVIDKGDSYCTNCGSKLNNVKEFNEDYADIKGGFADDLPDSDFNKSELEKGTKVELEHTNDPNVAKDIAKDHLTESPDYYKDLEEMEEDSVKSSDFYEVDDKKSNDKVVLKLLGLKTKSTSFKKIPSSTSAFAKKNAYSQRGKMYLNEEGTMGVTDRTKIGWSVEQDSGYGHPENRVNNITVYEKDGVAMLENNKGEITYASPGYLADALKMSGSNAKIYCGDESPIVFDTLNEDKSAIILAPMTEEGAEEKIQHPSNKFHIDYEQREGDINKDRRR